MASQSQTCRRRGILDDTLAGERFSALLLGLFALVALTLASVGIYSVLSYIVRGRRREIGSGARSGRAPATSCGWSWSKG